jgi:small subunit ribosomal protein S1
VDEDSQKIALGLKQLIADPWSSAQARYQVGQVHLGRVTRLAEFGAFVELEPGVEALAHASTFPPTGQAGGWSRSIPVGSTATVEILSVDPDRRRIGVAVVPEGSTRAVSATATTLVVPGARITGKVERHTTFGVFVFLAPGRTGLIPLAETGVLREADLASTFPVGSDVEVVVLEVDSTGRRIRLSRKAVLEAQEADELRAYTQRQQAAPAEGLGSLAEKLRGALGSRDS